MYMEKMAAVKSCDLYSSCSSRDTEYCCKQKASNNRICIWNSGSCIFCPSSNSCSSHTPEACCNTDNNCIWEGGQCKQAVCHSNSSCPVRPTEACCNSPQYWSGNSYYWCNWNAVSNKCNYCYSWVVFSVCSDITGEGCCQFQNSCAWDGESCMNCPSSTACADRTNVNCCNKKSECIWDESRCYKCTGNCSNRDTKYCCNKGVHCRWTGNSCIYCTEKTSCLAQTNEACCNFRSGCKWSSGSCTTK